MVFNNKPSNQICQTGFFPHWSGVVDSNHHSAIFTTTQAYLPPLTENEKVLFNAIWQYFSLHLTTTLIIVGSTLAKYDSLD